ncbi:MAG: tRNA pseudouridine(38-40) synthase TruA [Desulfobacterales bacterium]|nr:tRNA pseudouridine(38-40) synthase TruA [Desulfobacterales bacterium]
MVKNFKLLIEYDGTQYHGWQRQNGCRTIQEEIENVLCKMTCSQVVVQGSGRTDAGVHAMGQTASFLCETRIDPHQFLNGLNSLLPDDIIIKDCCYVPDDFHARFSAISKTYHYRIWNNPTPLAIGRQYIWHIQKALNTNAMQTALMCLIGTHDFIAFEKAGSLRSSTIRSIYKANLIDQHGVLTIEFQANGFLRCMVRNMVGTIVDVGRGRLSPDDIPKILMSKNRRQAGVTAPAAGLFLMEVDYKTCG